MRARTLVSFLAALLVAALASPAVAVLPNGVAPAGCVDGDVAAAAAALVHPAAEVVDVDVVAGLESALVLEPLIAPGTRQRLVRADGRWCDMTAFNVAWAASGRRSGTAQQAAAYASLAAAPYFDGVTVKRAVAAAPGVVTVDTHALTNGVTASWTVLLDRTGVRHAAWTATGFAVRPFEAEIEGVTALPGLQRSYLRDAAGALVAQQQITDVVVENPSAVTAVQFEDGFTIEVHASETPAGPNLGTDTGVTTVDYVRIMADTAKENYEDFLAWGLERGWLAAPTPRPHGGDADHGVVYVDSAITAYCLACVWIRDDFQIHMSSQVLHALSALGYRYPGASDRDALSNIVGHEMFHNFQNAYGKPGRNGASTNGAFSEGTARMQETMHAYSHISHQPQSLVYANDSNGCNGWDGSNRNNAFANGPLTGKSYSACYFWLTWQGTHGPEGIVSLLAAMHDHIKTSDGTAESFGAIAQATGADPVSDLVRFAASALTGDGYTWAAGDGTGEPLDWSQHLDRWQPPAMGVGESASMTLRNGGMLARESSAAVVPVATEPAVVAVVRAGADGVTANVLGAGAVVEAPRSGERVWVVAIKPELASSTVELRFDAPPQE